MPQKWKHNVSMNDCVKISVIGVVAATWYKCCVCFHVCRFGSHAEGHIWLPAHHFHM